MNHPVAVVPGALEALQGLSKAAAKTGVPDATFINVWNRLNAATRRPAGSWSATVVTRR